MTHNNRALVAAAALAAALGLASRAEATLARAVSFDEKVDKAAAIVVGKCVGTRSEWDAEHRFIVTYTTFQVEKTLKGQAGQEITVVTPGGGVGEIRQSTIGIPAFREGDERVVFVKNTSAGPTVLYFDQGAYEVKPDSVGEKTVMPVSSGAVHLDTQRGVAVAPEPPRTLREFERAIQDSAQRRRAQQMEMIRAREQQRTSIASTALKYKWLIGIALVGIAAATWQFLRR